MDKTGGRPVLNNKELVHRALDITLTPMQDVVISEMKFKFGQSWWKDGVLKNRYRFGIPDYAPDSDDVPDEAVRSYLDTTLCLNLIKEYELLPPGLHREARDPLSCVRDLRNNISHFGDPDYSEAQALNAISLINVLDEIMEFGRHEELKGLMVAALAPMPGDAPDETVVPEPSPVVEKTGPQRAEERPENPTGMQRGTPAPVPPREPGQRCTQVEACVMASRGMYEKLKTKQQTDKRDTSRFVTKITKCVRKGDHYVLTMDKSMMMDDSLGIIVNGREFTNTQVSFDRYNSASRTVHMFPGTELQEVMDEGPTDIQMFSDMKWLISKTGDFFESFGSMMRFPPTPMAYTPGILLKGMNISDEQKEAVTMAMGEPLSYVWGVPGSGKTQSVLAASIAECVSRGERVAVIAPTNLALEQVLRGLLKAFMNTPQFRDIIDPARDILRIGTPTSEFAAEFPDICEGSGVRTQLISKIQLHEHIVTTLLERRYERYRGVCDECAEKARRIGPKDVSGRKSLMKSMEPVLDAMKEDERYRLNANRVNQGNIVENIPRIISLIYDHDRTDYLEGDLMNRTDESLESWLTDIEGQIGSLRPKDRASDFGSIRVVAMTLSKFIISYGPVGDEHRRALDVDHVFVDEAGYCNCLQTLALFTLDAPITLLGDHMQLPPVCELKHKELNDLIDIGGDDRFDYLWDLSALYVDHFFDDDLSIMRRMYKESEEPDFVHMAHRELRTTFRFGPNLAEVLGRHVYPAGMFSASDNPLEVTVIKATIDAFPFEYGEYKRKNIEEALAISAIVDSMELKGDDFVVMTPYVDQIKCLQRVDPQLADHVLTIHKSQGREWDTVIISVVDGHHNPEDKPPRFTSSQVIENARDGLKVINTALSRAKRRLIIVCDADHWAGRPDELLGDIVRNNG